LSAQRKLDKGMNPSPMEAEIAAWLGSVQNRAIGAARRAKLPATERVSIPIGIVSHSSLEIREEVRQKSGYISNR
jgi:hypothetical protein